VRSSADRKVHRQRRGPGLDGRRGRRAASAPGRRRVARDEVRNPARRGGRGGAGSGGLRRPDRLPLPVL